jgi:dihydrodipicolinate synthase/N-acetylneuraminate lyase
MQTTIEMVSKRRKLRRKVKGIAAALLPFNADGTIAIEAFQQHLRRTHQAGLMNAVNMDTGYVNLLSEAEKLYVLRSTREALGDGVPFVAGAYIEKQSGNLVDLYRRQMEFITQSAGIPILFQTARLHGTTPAEKADAYRRVCGGFNEILAFELSPRFAPNGEIFDEETFLRLMEIPEIKGLKHSSLDRPLEFERLTLRDKHRSDFSIYSGNDLGIDMIEYGSDYLLGLATFAPERFAERDKLWEQGDPRYYQVSDALQYLGNVSFRDPVPAYKHSAAMFLFATGRIPTAFTHPMSATRPSWEIEILQDCAARLGLPIVNAHIENAIAAPSSP